MIDRGAVLHLLNQGLTQTEVARQLEVTKNVVAGIWRDYGDPTHVREPLTLAERCDALNRAMDVVLRETRDVGRVPNVPKLRVVR